MEMTRQAKVCRMFLAVLALLCSCMLSDCVHPKLNYSDVSSLGRSCQSLDSCQYRLNASGNSLEGTQENCACDSLCREYEDCCVDAPFHIDTSLKSSKKEKNWKCFYMRQFGGVFMRDKCSPEVSVNEGLVELCEKINPDDYSDPLGTMPVTDALTGHTFRNFYCGLCNGKKDELHLWTPRLECPTLTLYNSSRKNLTQKYVAENLVYDGRNWGIYLDGDNGSVFFHDCFIDPVMPEQLLNKIRLCKTQLISDCAQDWTDEDVRKKCLSYTGIRFYHSESYRNIHCALCNRMNLTLLTCHPVEYREMFVFRTFEHRAFSILLDINELKGQNVGTLQNCQGDSIYDPFFKKCRQFSCIKGTVRIGNECIPTNRTSSATTREPSNTNATSHEVSTNDERGGKGVLNISEGAYNLSAFDCLLISLVSEDYIMFENKTIYVPQYDKLYEPTRYLSSDGSVLVCSHLQLTEPEKFSSVMGYVTVAGLGISMLCLFLHFMVFCWTPDLRNLSGKNLLSQCVSLFFAYCSYIASQYQVGADMCTVLAFSTMYFFLASFFWMSSMAFDVWRTLKMATTELRVTSGKQSKRFILYSFYSWIMPILILVVAAFAEYTDMLPEEYRPRFGKPLCWFNSRRALLCFFAVPLFAVTLSNIILFASSAKMIILTTRTTVKQQNHSQRRNFRLYLRLFILMGLTWAVGLISGYLDVEILWYVFIVLNTLQGLFIFLCFSCTTKVMNHFRDRVVKFTKSEYRSTASHSTSHSGCNTNSTTALTNVSIKPTTKLWPMKKYVTSPTNSSASSS